MADACGSSGAAAAMNFNIGVLGHIDSGKTTLGKHVLHKMMSAYSEQDGVRGLRS